MFNSKTQYTLTYPVGMSGKGIHYGKECLVKIHPAAIDHGIIFVRTDITDNNIILASYKNFQNSTQCSVISNKEGVTISTVEHLLCALWALNITNARIEVNGPEMPILDGSSEDYIFILKSGIPLAQEKQATILTLRNTVKVNNNDTYIQAEPSNNFKVKYMLDYPASPLLSKQTVEIEIDQNTSSSEFTMARTFIMFKDIEPTRNAELIKGGNETNVLVIDNDKIVAGNKYRYFKEPVRHKILDLIGDLYLSGFFIIASFECHKSGHKLNNLFLHKLLKDPENYLLHN